jgi:hypothetical protein
MSTYIKIFVRIAEDLIEKQLYMLSAPPNRKTQIIKCIRILETIIMRKALAYIKLKNSAICANCNIQLVIIAPWWELDNNTQMHVCVKCCTQLCENCAYEKCIACMHNRYLTFDIYQQLVTVYACVEKNELPPSIVTQYQ